MLLFRTDGSSSPQKDLLDVNTIAFYWTVKVSLETGGMGLNKEAIFVATTEHSIQILTSFRVVFATAFFPCRSMLALGERSLEGSALGHRVGLEQLLQGRNQRVRGRATS